MGTFLERKTLRESPRSPSTSSTPISRPSPPSFSEEVQVTMPVTDVLDEEGVEHQTIQTEKEEDKDKLTLELERIDNAKKIMTNEECENFQAKLLDTLYGSSKWYQEWKKEAKAGIPAESKEDENMNDDDEEDDNLSAAKVWAQQQKQSCLK